MLQKGYKKGFTLIELIIVIAVISILTIFALPKFIGILESANASNVKNDTATIQSAVKSYVNSVGAVPVKNININALTNQGISSTKFQEAASDTTFYVIDFSILGSSVTNIEDGSDVKSFLPTKIATSVVESVSSTGAVTLSSKIKRTSVVYVMNKNYDVFALSLFKASDLGNQTNFTSSITDSEKAKLLVGISIPVIGALTVSVSNDNIFKTKYIEIKAANAGNFATSIDVDDSNAI